MPHQIRVIISPSKNYMRKNNLEEADRIIIETNEFRRDYEEISNKIERACLEKGIHRSGRQWCGIHLILDELKFTGIDIPCEQIKSLVCNTLSLYKEIEYTIKREKITYEREDRKRKREPYDDYNPFRSETRKAPFSIICPTMFNH